MFRHTKPAHPIFEFEAVLLVMLRTGIDKDENPRRAASGHVVSLWSNREKDMAQPPPYGYNENTPR
jgi:hypothetical protein